jgi:hypothetical protein
VSVGTCPESEANYRQAPENQLRFATGCAQELQRSIEVMRGLMQGWFAPVALAIWSSSIQQVDLVLFAVAFFFLFVLFSHLASKLTL